MASNDEDYYYDEDAGANDDDDSTQRLVWEVLSWIAVALTIILNLALVAILLIRRNFFTFVNKGERLFYHSCWSIAVTCQC